MPAKRWLAGLVLTASLAWAQGEKPGVVPLVTSPRWQMENSEKLALDAVRGWGGNPAVEHEYGVTQIERQKLRQGNKTAVVIVEQAADPSSAYGLLTFYQTEGMAPAKDMPLTRLDSREALVARGPFFIRIPRDNPENARLSEADFTSLLAALAGTGSAARLNIPIALPTQGLVLTSEKYLLGEDAARAVLPSFRTDLIGFALGAEARLASYATPSGRARVLVVDYPTPQMARERYDAMQKDLNLNASGDAGTVFGKRSGSFVVLVLDPSSRVVASRLLSQFGYSQQVVRNERYPGDESITMQMVRLVLANLMLTFVLAGFALGGGLIFIASKFVARKWFPESSWGQPDEATIIRLKLL